MTGGFTDEGLAALDAALAGHTASGAVPGLVALVARGGQVHVTIAGHRGLGDGAPIGRDAIFRIASMTKPVIGVAAMLLVQDGAMALGDPVARWLPELSEPRVLRSYDAELIDTAPAERAITVEDLLSFRLGFGSIFTPQPLPILEAEQALDLKTLGPPWPPTRHTPDQWIAAFGSLPLLDQPGERFRYNTGATLAGILIERVAGAPLGEVLDKRVFEPLGMTDTAFWTAQTDRLATAYLSGPDGLVAWDEPDGKYSRPPAFEDGAGGLVSTADDMLAFARMFLRGGDPVLSTDSVRAMTTDQLTPEQKARGGLGPDFFTGQSWSFCQAVQDDGSFGWDGGFGSTWHVHPGSDLTVIVLSQRMFDGPQLPALHADIRAAAYAALA
jgi:CubicO group peptidase (beta-lactamase class C family)